MRFAACVQWNSRERSPRAGPQRSRAPAGTEPGEWLDSAGNAILDVMWMELIVERNKECAVGLAS